MQFKSFIITALAVTVAAERVPYQLARRSVSLVALATRQEPGYQPAQTFCGDGENCAVACGSGFEQCASTDGLSHCYNKEGGESCCKDDNGNACEKDYYCAADTIGSTWCCPNDMSADECAKAYEVKDGLSSQVPSAVATPTGTAGAIFTGGSHNQSTNGTAVITAPSSPTATSEPGAVDQPAGAGTFVSSSGALIAAIAAVVAFI